MSKSKPATGRDLLPPVSGRELEAGRRRFDDAIERERERELRDQVAAEIFVGEARALFLAEKLGGRGLESCAEFAWAAADAFLEARRK